jgi:hypothetical protein
MQETLEKAKDGRREDPSSDFGLAELLAGECWTACRYIEDLLAGFIDTSTKPGEPCKDDQIMHLACMGQRSALELSKCLERLEGALSRARQGSNDSAT